jgi:hypothetical protein
VALFLGEFLKVRLLRRPHLHHQNSHQW